MGIYKYPWLVGKILALAYIFIGGGILAVVIAPFVLMWADDRQEKTQEIVRFMFRTYIRLLQVFRMVNFSIECAHDLKNNCAGKILISNHPSLLDVVVLMAFIPRAQCVVKNALWNHRFLGCLMRSAGYIRNDLSVDELVAQCKGALDHGRCLIVFPEGTRSVPGEFPVLLRGFANIAFLAKVSVQSVFISCDPPILFKGEPWYQVPDRRPFFRVVLGECLDKNSGFMYDHRSIAVRKIVSYFEAYYRKMIQYG